VDTDKRLGRQATTMEDESIEKARELEKKTNKGQDKRTI